MKQKKKTYVVHSPVQKLWGVLALGMLFVCGLMVGVGFTKHYTQQVVRPDIVESESKDTCAIIEEIQLQWLADESSPDDRAHKSNLRIYETLFQHGCPENKNKYRDAIAREMEILAALTGQQSGQTTCRKIEASLLERLPDDYVDLNFYGRFERAKIYANLSERGCPENTAKYVELAKQELAIARALQDDDFSRDDTIEIVETYKRLNLQAAAEEFFETAKRLTNPTIDFILEIEKIINEP